MKKLLVLLFVLLSVNICSGVAASGAKPTPLPNPTASNIKIKYPSTDAVVAINKAAIEWVDSYKGTDHYLWLVEEGSNKIILKNITIKKGVNKYSIPAKLLTPGEKYRYKVGVMDAKKKTTYTALKYFQVAEKPTITYPSNGSDVKRSDASIMWNIASSASNYVLRVADDENGTVILNNITPLKEGEHVVPPLDIQYGRSYRFVLGVKDTYGNITWSEVNKFKVKDKQAPTFAVDLIDKDSYQNDVNTKFYINMDNKPIKLSHVEYKNSIVQRPGSIIKIPLGKKYMIFSSVIGLDDSVYTKGGSVIFKLYGDGRLLYESKVISNDISRYYHSMQRKIDVNVFGIEELTLQVTDAGDGTDNDSGVWADPYLAIESKDESYPTARYVQGDDEPGTLLYSNFPESVMDNHVNNQPVCVLMRRDSVIGKNAFIADHMNVTSNSKPKHFGVLLHNKTQSVAHVVISKKGISSVPSHGSIFMKDALREYVLSNQSSIDIEPGGYFWLFDNPTLLMEPASQTWGDFVNAMAEFDTDQVLEVTVCIMDSPTYFSEPSKVDAFTEVPFEASARQYRGTTDTYPVTNLDLSVSINDWDVDNTPLVVSYPLYNAKENKWNRNFENFPGWVTNITSDKNEGAIISDMFTFKEKYNGADLLLSPTLRFPEGAKYLTNLGNWGIWYNEKIHIKNNTDKDRKVSYYLGSVVAGSGYQQALIFSPEGEALKDMDPNRQVYKQELIKLVKEVEVPAFGEADIVFQYILPNNSSGGIYHAIVQAPNE
ncbi:MAG TPA: NPCBM/NEW2 domain-containing protein [Pseudobacteroides sp.]|uniref:NPCBM/NEW2 domain-containing protein n=1 Tax=Pseudobacteroides sp. TaxID=1968840 RepID=UPI002F92D5E5